MTIQEKNAPSRYPTVQFWSRLGVAVIVLAVFFGIGGCVALASLGDPHNECTAATIDTTPKTSV
jgi:hypothetical protein